MGIVVAAHSIQLDETVMTPKSFHVACLLSGLAATSGCGGILGIYELSEAGADTPVSDAGVLSDIAEDRTTTHDGSMPDDDARADSSGGSTLDAHVADTGPSDSGDIDTGTADSGEASTDAAVCTPACVGTTPVCLDGFCASTTATSCPAAGGPGLDNCGPGGSGTESCCASLEVPGGTYSRTYTYGEVSTYADSASVSGFRLDKYLVTVGRFRQFVTAWNNGTGYLPTKGSGKHTHLNGGLGLAQGPNVASGQTYESGWDAVDWNNTTDVDPTTTNLQCGSPYNTWTATPTTNENLPLNCVTWFESYAFCIWDGGFLPSEAESEYAAAGGSQQLEYPWGNPASTSTTDPGTANQYAIYDDNYTGNATDIASVGYASLGAGAWGQLDLAGEVFEWNLDGYASPYPDPCIDCAYLTTASFQVVRGGGFRNIAPLLVPPSRLDFAPAGRDYSLGFRCARTP
jgi:formylglycine-generating enzyme required for sulfatase activity